MKIETKFDTGDIIYCVHSSHISLCKVKEVVISGNPSKTKYRVVPNEFHLHSVYVQEDQAFDNVQDFAVHVLSKITFKEVLEDE